MPRKFRTKEWVVMVFIANDNDLGSFTRAKIEEIETVGSTLAADVVIQFDTPGTSAIRRMRLSKQRKFPLRRLQLETNTGDKRTLIRFADLTMEDFHPRRAMLILSNHGSGIAIANDDLLVAERDGRFRRNDHKCHRIHQQEPIFRMLTPNTALYDHNIDKPATLRTDALDNMELKSALKSIARRHGRVELLAFDACLMNTIEVAFQLRTSVRFMVGSQSNIPVPGCTFSSTFTLMRDESLPTQEVAKAIVRGVTPVQFDEVSAMAALDLDKADDVAESVSVLAEALISYLRNDPNALFEVTVAHLSALAMPDSDTIDLFDFCEKLTQRVKNDDVVEAATDVQDAVDQLVLLANPQGAVVKGARGISITLPRRNDISDAYRQLDFARETSWVDFLKSYLPLRFP